jgi:hypothetical protein
MLTRKYNKKRLRKTLSKKKYKKTKKQKGGVICQTPNTVKVQTSYFNKSNDKKVNSEAYIVYLGECKEYSTCCFQNINNIDLIVNVLAILKDIFNNETNFKYKNIVDTSNEKYKNTHTMRFAENIVTQKEKILTSKFLDIYVTSLLEKNLGLKFIDNNTVFLQEDDYDFIIKEDTDLAKNFIISTLINLEDNLLVKSLIQILSDTVKVIIEDKFLIKNFALSFGEMFTDLETTSRDRAIVVSNIIFYTFIQIFLLTFSKYITSNSLLKRDTKSYTIMCLAYKILFSYLQNILVGWQTLSDGKTHLLPFLNDGRFDKYIIGTDTENIANLPIFAHLINTITSVDCIIENFLRPERLTVLCRELDGFLTKGEPLNKLKDKTFLSEGCITNILIYGWSIELVKEIYNFLKS